MHGLEGAGQIIIRIGVKRDGLGAGPVVLRVCGGLLGKEHIGSRCKQAWEPHSHGAR